MRIGMSAVGVVMKRCWTSATSSGSPWRSAKPHAATRASGTESSSKGLAPRRASPPARLPSADRAACPRTLLHGRVDAMRHDAQALEQLGGAVDLVGRRDHRDAHGEPGEVVVAEADLAAGVVE